MSGPKETAYDERIAPLMTQIIALCQEHKINMFATFALDEHGEDGLLKCTTALSGCDPDDADGRKMVNACDDVARPKPFYAAFTITTAKR